MASWLNLLTSVSQTAVSIDGTVKNTLLPFVSLSLSGFKSLSTTVKSGAVSPTFTCVPFSVIGFPWNVTFFYITS